MSRIQFALCGSYSSELDPYKATAPSVCQEILSLINLSPQTPGKIAKALGLSKEEVTKHLKALEKPGLVERLGHRYKPSFAIFSPQDQERLRPLIDELSGLLAKVAQENMELVRNTYLACGFSEHGFSFDETAYILMGAYAFDYGGLEALSKAGFLMVSKPMPGGDYIFGGLEGELDLRTNWQWGHSRSFGPFTFFSHGELPAEGPRRAFPEEAYKWLKEGHPEEEVTAAMEEVGQILLALYEKPAGLAGLASRAKIEHRKLQEHLELLQELEYIGVAGDGFISRCPVIGKKASEWIWNLAEALQAEFITEALGPNWERMRRIYRETAPARNGIDISEGFNMVYHLVFEQASRSLMEQGSIPWPKRRADGARYAIWLQHNTE